MKGQQEKEYNDNDACLDGVDREEAAEYRDFKHGLDHAQAGEQRQQHIQVPSEP